MHHDLIYNIICSIQRRTSIDCDELFEIMEEGDIKKIDAFMEQLINFYNNADLNSDVAHLMLQLAICYDHSTLVEPLIQQYKVACDSHFSMYMHVRMYMNGMGLTYR